MNDPVLALARRVERLEQTAVRYRQGVVTATAPLSVALGGSDIAYTDVKQLAGVTLAIGEPVAVLTFGADLLVLGRIT